MKQTFILGAAAIFLAGCSGNPLDPLGTGTGLTDGESDIIETEPDTCGNAFVCTGDVVDVTYDSVGDILYITGTPFDETELAGTYVRAGGDINGVPTYINDDPDRFNDYLAYYFPSAGDEVAVGAIGIEGYQSFGYGGTYIILNEAATSLPTEGLVEFTGVSAGVMVYTGNGSLDATSGDVTMQVDFTDNRLKGFVENRTIVGGAALEDLVLNDSLINDGAFIGTSNSYDGPDVVESGIYSGVFAGTDGSIIAGTYVATNPDFEAGDPDDDSDNVISRDTGVFIVTD